MPARKITSQSPSAPAAAPRREQLYQLFRARPMDDQDLLVNLTMYMRSGPLAKLLFLDEVFRDDEVHSLWWPWRVPTWNGNLFTVHQIRIRK